MSSVPFSLLETIRSTQIELDRLHRELASCRATLRLPAGSFSVLRCRIAERVIVLLLSEVQEVLRMAALTTLPEAPVWLAGLLVLGPERIPVIDLSVRETGLARELDPDDFLVITEVRGRRQALVVQAIDGQLEMTADQIHKPAIDLPFGPYVLGTCAVEGEPAILITASPLTLHDF
jgi:chemotaxis signal transduction protein